MPRPIHFEIPADRPERAVAFYEHLFGWQFQKWDGPMPYWLVRTGDGPASTEDSFRGPIRGREP